MDFLALAKQRYSVRSYNDKKVEQEKIEKILLAAQAAPTAANLQPIRIIVVSTDKALEKLGKGARFYGAPLAFIICASRDEAWKRKYDNKCTSDIDAAIVTDHMMLEAASLGLGSLWMCWFKPEVIREAFNIPDDLEPVNILGVGYTDEEPQSPDRHSTARKPLTETVFYETM
ncbi:MAG: nitroreductase family protein [Huintestinicola sp.]